MCVWCGGALPEVLLWFNVLRDRALYASTDSMCSYCHSSRELMVFS